MTKNKEAGMRNKPKTESNTKVFSSTKHIFSQTSGVVYHSKEDLMNPYDVKVCMANNEIRELFPKVEKTS